jgi:hypothetical protein
MGVKIERRKTPRGIDIGPILIWIGVAISAFLFLESWLEVTEQPVSFVKLFHDNGLTGYKPAREPNKGIWHMVGWIGSSCFVIMMLYSVRKRFKFMTDVGPIRYWLDIHMFLGILGTVLVTAHSTYKFGGIVSLSYWSAVLVAVSGFLGRYLYVHIPRTVSGNEMVAEQLDKYMEKITAELAKFSTGTRLSELVEAAAPVKSGNQGDLSALITMVSDDFATMRAMGRVKAELKRDKRSPEHAKRTLYWLLNEKRRLHRARVFLDVSHRLLHHWHIFHKPFAIIMFIVMFLHIAVFYMFRV